MTSQRLGTQPWVIDDDEPVEPFVWGWRTQAAMQAEGRARDVLREREEAAAKERQWKQDQQLRLQAGLVAARRR